MKINDIWERSQMHQLAVVRLARALGLAMITVGILSACGGGSNPPTSTPASTPPAASNTQTYSISGSIAGLASGASVVLQDNDGDSLTVTDNGSFKFANKVTEGNAYAVSVLTQPLRQLCAVTNGGGTASADVTNVQVACVSGPEYVYAANVYANNVSAYRVDPTTGVLTPIPGSPFAAGTQPRTITVNAAGTFAYVANQGDGRPDGSISAYSIDPATGALTQVSGSPFATETAPQSIAVNPAGTFVYAVEPYRDNVYAFSIDRTTGALTPIAGSPFSVGNNPQFIVINPAGTFAYVTNSGQGGYVSVYKIDPTTGALTQISGSPFSTGAGSIYVTVNPAGTSAYVTGTGVSAYKIEPTTGALTQISGSPFAAGTDPASVTVNPASTFAYWVNSGSNNVSAYGINPTTGALTEISGSPFTAGTEPFSVTVNPAGTFAYVANFGNSGDGNNNGDISGYRIDLATGALTQIQGSPFAVGTSPASIVVAQP